MEACLRAFARRAGRIFLLLVNFSSSNQNKNSFSDASSAVSFGGLAILEQMRGGKSEVEQLLFAMGSNFNNPKITTIVSCLILFLNFLQLVSFIFTVDTFDKNAKGLLSAIEAFRLQFLLSRASFSAFIAVFAIITAVATVFLGFTIYLVMFWRFDNFPFPYLLLLLR